MNRRRLDNRPVPDHEMLLIRVGHRLWQEFKDAHNPRRPQGWGKLALGWALQTIWDAKEEIRRPLRIAWLESLENQKRHLAQIRVPFRSNR